MQFVTDAVIFSPVELSLSVLQCQRTSYDNLHTLDSGESAEVKVPARIEHKHRYSSTSRTVTEPTYLASEDRSVQNLSRIVATTSSVTISGAGKRPAHAHIISVLRKLSHTCAGTIMHMCA